MKMKLIPLAFCILAAFECSVALANDTAPACPAANDYIQAYNLPEHLPAHTVYDIKVKGNLTENVKIKTDSNWLLTIKNIAPNPNTPIKILKDIADAVDLAENDAVTNLQDSQNKIASATTAKTDKWNGKKTINVWKCEYSIKNHPDSYADAILPRE